MKTIILLITFFILVFILTILIKYLKRVEKSLLLKCLFQLGLSETNSYTFLFLNYKTPDFHILEEKLVNGNYHNMIVIFIGPEWLFKTKQKKLSHINLVHAPTLMNDTSLFDNTNIIYIYKKGKIKFIENANTYV